MTNFKLLYLLFTLFVLPLDYALADSQGILVNKEQNILSFSQLFKTGLSLAAVCCLVVIVLRLLAPRLKAGNKKDGFLQGKMRVLERLQLSREAQLILVETCSASKLLFSVTPSEVRFHGVLEENGVLEKNGALERTTALEENGSLSMKIKNIQVAAEAPSLLAEVEKAKSKMRMLPKQA